ncbi:MAG TPA: SsgA family sporulation/cell division regulator [Mycobacteriales bacterium]|nr:SsgA family sporulation/cell division regulator [Mycobacteriales bacterium]
MLDSSRTVTTRLMLTVSASTGDARLEAELRYDLSDPLAVSLAIGTQCDEPVVWVFARDLLSAGIAGPTGDGDITIEPYHEDGEQEIRITLATDCLATLLAPRDKVAEFLIETFTRVPSGAEFDNVDFDAEIAALLA